MLVVDHNDSNHTIRLVPRDYPSTGQTITLELRNEYTKDVSTLADPDVTWVSTGGYLDVSFPFTIAENDKFRVKITNDTGGAVLYRGLLKATDQDTQEFNYNQDAYHYE